MESNGVKSKKAFKPSLELREGLLLFQIHCNRVNAPAFISWNVIALALKHMAKV
jgi:hypothetical protein